MGTLGSIHTLESELKTTLFSAPRWMQLQLQGFWYGLVSDAIRSIEEDETLLLEPTSIESWLLYADSQFEGWPTSWLEPIAKQFLSHKRTLDELNIWFESLDTTFRDCVPVDLNIFTTLANGEILTEEQWERLYDTLAFLPPPNHQQLSLNQKRSIKCPKTRHIHGRRALTPMRSRRAITRKKHKYYSFIKLQ
jgi:hypothetical protein